MVQYKETIMKMEPCYSGSIVTQVSVSKALQLFTVTKDDGMVLNQAVNLQVSSGVDHTNTGELHRTLWMLQMLTSQKESTIIIIYLFSKKDKSKTFSKFQR